jgi:hypothetical protein
MQRTGPLDEFSTHVTSQCSCLLLDSYYFWVTYTVYYHILLRVFEISTFLVQEVCISVLFTLLSHVQPDDGHHEGPKHVVAS